MDSYITPVLSMTTIWPRELICAGLSARCAGSVEATIGVTAKSGTPPCRRSSGHLWSPSRNDVLSTGTRSNAVRGRDRPTVRRAIQRE